MKTRRQVGIILPTHVLRRTVQRKPTWESAVKYAAAAEKAGLEVVVFSLKGYNPQRNTVRGYVRRAGKWEPWRGSLPRVVHNRIIPHTLGSFHLLRMLTKQLGRGLFNPPVSRDKWYVWRRLEDSEAIRDHLPPTWPLSLKLCRKLPDLIYRHRGVVIKPRHGGLGAGILFIEPVPGRHLRYRLIPTRGRSRVIGKQALIRLLHRRIARRRYIVQGTVPLVKYLGRRCDMRVPVQRAGDGKWCVMNATIKRATRHRYLTNIARGGKAYGYRSVLEAMFGANRVSDIWADISRLSLAVAERLSKHYPQLADLGLDIGIDAAGRPWLIEVNFRDQRLPSKRAGQGDTHTQLYHNPMAYANYLMSRPRGRAI